MPQEFRAATSDKAAELEEEAKDLSEVKVFEVELWRHDKDQWQVSATYFADKFEPVN